MSEFINSIIASITATLIMQPLDVIRTQYQINISKSDNNINNIYKNIIKQQGIKGFYKGTTSHLLTYPIFWAIFFQTKQYDFTLSKNKVANNILSSLLSGTIASTIANPLFVLKIRKQSEILHGSKNNNYMNLVSKIYIKEGIFGFLKGMNVTIFNNFKLGIQFPIFDYLMEKTNKNIFLSSIVSKLIATSIFYPSDIIRTLQRDSIEKITSKEIIKKIYKLNGLSGFYRGLLLHNIVSGPNFILMMFIKTKLEKFIY